MIDAIIAIPGAIISIPGKIYDKIYDATPDEIKSIPGEIFESLSNIKSKDVADGIILTVKTVASATFAIGVITVSTNVGPYILGISVFTGMAFPDFFMERTAQVWATIFQTASLPLPPNPSNKTIPKITYFVKNCFNYFSPIVITGTISFFAIPVSGQIYTVLAGLRLGSYLGKKADLMFLANQPLYIKHKC